MQKVDADRNLLFAVMALRTGMVDENAVLAAMQTWAAERARDLGEILVTKGVLREDRREWINAMVTAQVEGQHALVSTLRLPSKLLASLAQGTTAGFAGTTPSVEPAEGGDSPQVTGQTLEAQPAPSTSDVTLAFGPSQNATVALSQGTGPEDLFARQVATTGKARFRILRHHAKGGLGEVFVAFDEELGREVALKEIKEHHADDPRSKARFVLEAEVTGSLEHPGVVPVYSLNWYENGRPYYAMRFIRGESFSDVIERYHTDPARFTNPGQATLDFRAMLRQFIDVCNAIAYAHSRGVLHRDLKPSNIMLGRYGETLVVDWGLAKSIAQPEITGLTSEVKFTPSAGSGTAETLPGSAIGTPQYMSPEQAAGDLDKIGPASDVYSLGATLYCVLTGHVPFENPDVAITLHMVQKGYFPAPRVHNPSLSRALEAICLKAMALNPEDRYPTPRDLKEDIEHWLANEPVAAYAEPWSDRLARWSRRHQSWMAAGAVAVVLVALVSSLSAFAIHRERVKEARERRKAERLTAGLVLDRALDQFDNFQSGRGMLALAYGLTLAKPEDADLERSFRRNLNGWGQRLPELQLVLPRPDVASSVAFQPHARVAAAGGTSIEKGVPKGEVRFWNADTGEPVGGPLQHPDQVRSISFRSDGKVIATGCDDGLVRLWDMSTHRETGKALEHGAHITCVAFNNDGTLLAAGGQDGRVKIWSTADGMPLKGTFLHPAAVNGLAFNPTSATFVTGCADGIGRVWTMNSEVEPVTTAQAHEGAINSVAFRPDGKVFLTGGLDGIVRLWDAASGQLTGPHPLEHGIGLYAVTYSPDGSIIASGAEDNTTKLWIAATGEPYCLPMEHRGSVVAIAFSADGKSVLTGCQDNFTRLWTIPATTAEETILAHEGAVTAVHFGNGAEAILSAGLDATVQFRTRSGKLLCPPLVHPAPVRSAAMSPDGKYALTGCDDGKARLWNLNDGHLVATPCEHSLPVTAVRFRQDGKALMTGSSDGTAHVWDMLTRSPIGPALHHNWSISAVDFQPGEGVVLTAGGNLVRFWQPASGFALDQTINNPGPIYTACYRPDGKVVLTGGENNTAQLWNAETCRPVGLPMSHEAAVMSAAFGPQGRTVLTGSHDHTARLWDAAAGIPLGPPMRHPSRVLTVAFGPLENDNVVATGCEDGHVRFWDVPYELEGPPERLVRWVETLTGLTLDVDGSAYGVVRALDPTSLAQKRRELKALGGPPALEPLDTAKPAESARPR